jgi:ubiquinone/menaquinone biosynthesis C-methylase UbiE
MKAAATNPFSDPSLVDDYEAWYEGSGRRADRLEKSLLLRLVDWIDGSRTMLDVGSGTGHFARFLNSVGFQVVGLDVSLPMVCESARLGSPPTILGDAHRLPFVDRSFDLVTMVATLEFVSTPRQVIEEAARVARRGLLIGALNRNSRLGHRFRFATDEPWKSAHLFTVSELRRCIAAACRDRANSLTWQTTLWPGLSMSLQLPWGSFIGLAVRWSGRREEEPQK